MSDNNSLYENHKGMGKDITYINKIDKEMDWESYDPTKWPCADMSFPDLDPNEKHDVWPFKPDIDMSMHAVSWVDLNQFRNGLERYGYLLKLKLPEKLECELQSDIKKTLEKMKELQTSNADVFYQKLQEYEFIDAKHFDYWHYLYNKKTQLSQQEIYKTNKTLKDLSTNMEHQKNANVEAAKTGGLLDPIEGVDIETWAAVNAKIANGADLEQVLKVVGVEKPIWDKVSADWTARMSQDTTYAISQVYADAFVNPNIGKFASIETTKGSESAQGVDSGAMQKVKDDFELYIKIQSHQNVAFSQGIAANTILEEYGLSPADWGAIGAHWAVKMTTDISLVMKMAELTQKYDAEFAANTKKAGEDIDF
ncbi:DUF6620 family protein [Allomuricauda sp. F6463D]|uniref:DUF6620 family protein n=1 Tax=Allomuricauda sp. F6463D TaxID=2926409 RepID=UPI001FF1AE6C|nr:DUF6620 family protein [Muricauda sp. F6463D]MCK0161178.1 hypothetical protein [Muricauda sp. F6463D]